MLNHGRLISYLSYSMIFRMLNNAAISLVLILCSCVPKDGNEVFFRIKRSTQLRKLMSAYCDRQSMDFNAIAFLFDGRRLRGEQTPDEVTDHFVLSIYCYY